MSVICLEVDMLCLPVPACCKSLLLGCSCIEQARGCDSITAGAMPACWLPKVAPSHTRFLLKGLVHQMLLQLGLSNAKCATPPANTAVFGRCCYPRMWRPSALSWATFSRYPSLTCCCRRSYSTGSHGALQRAAAVAAVMKASVRRGTCVSPGRARVQRLQDLVQPPELALLSTKAVASPEGQVRKPAQHGVACPRFCAAC